MGHFIWHIPLGSVRKSRQSRFRWNVRRANSEDQIIPGYLRSGKFFKTIFVDVLINRLQSLVDYMRSQASDGNEDFQSNIDEGHLHLYLDDIKYLTNNKEEIIYGIQSI